MSIILIKLPAHDVFDVTTDDVKQLPRCHVCANTKGRIT